MIIIAVGIVFLVQIVSPMNNAAAGFGADNIRFAYPMKNVTVIVGRTAILTCVLDELNNYRVAWIKIETKSILAIHNQILVSDNRLVAAHNNFNTWTLTIKSVRISDRGQYMCQVNSNPVITQTAFLEVHVPPDIIHEETSGDLTVYEGESVKLVCKARGFPRPQISWRRDDEKPMKSINYQTNQSSESSESSKRFRAIDGTLVLINLTRFEMGNYLCIASNGVPPAISKTIKIFIYFRPFVYTSNRRVGSKLNSRLTINCCIEAYPKTIKTWTGANGSRINSNGKYHIRETEINSYTTLYELVIANVTATDMQNYKCSSRNSIGFAEITIKVYDIDADVEQTGRQSESVASNRSVLVLQNGDDKRNESRARYSESDSFATNELPNRAIVSYAKNMLKVLHYFMLVIIILF